MPEPNKENRADLELLTVADVCTLFQVTRDWVYDEVEAGRLPYVRLGRKHLRFRRPDLERFLSRPGSRGEPRMRNSAQYQESRTTDHRRKHGRENQG